MLPASRCRCCPSCEPGRQCPPSPLEHSSPKTHPAQAALQSVQVLGGAGDGGQVGLPPLLKAFKDRPVRGLNLRGKERAPLKMPTRSHNPLKLPFPAARDDREGCVPSDHSLYRLTCATSFSIFPVIGSGKGLGLGSSTSTPSSPPPGPPSPPPLPPTEDDGSPELGSSSRASSPRSARTHAATQSAVTLRNV